MGYYRGRIEVNFAGGSASAQVILQVNTNPKLFLSNSGDTVNATEAVGLATPAMRSFSLFTSDGSSARYSAQVIGSAPWLTLSPGGTGGTSPATISYTINPAGLVSSAYYARIRVTSPDVLNSPQDYLVVLNVSPAGVPAPSLSPAGLAFRAKGNTAPPVQTLQVFTNTGTAAAIQLGVNTADGGSWLSAKSSAATASASNPALVQVTVNPAGLSLGAYRGTITVSGGGSTKNASVLLVVAPAGAVNSPDSTSAATANCTATSLAVVQTALEGNFFLFVGWPGTVSALVLDDCGNAVSNAAAAASFSNGDDPIPLGIKDPAVGAYSGTWVPHHAVAGVVTVTATAPGLTPSTMQSGGATAPNAVPMLRGDGPLHIFNPRPSDPLAPGTLLQIYGSGLGNSASTTTVDIGGVNAFLLYVGDTQINVQVPLEVTPGERGVGVAVGAALAQALPLTINPITPGVAQFPDGFTIAQHGNYSLVTCASPAAPKEYVVLYLAGMGLTDHAEFVIDGMPSPYTPLATITPLPTVMLDGNPIIPVFAGLSPGIIGIYQINFAVPDNPRTGYLQLQVLQSGAPTNTSLLPVGTSNLCP